MIKNIYWLKNQYISEAMQTLNHWSRVRHKCVGNVIIIGSDTGLSPGGHHAIIQTNAAILLIEHLRTNFS